MDLSDTERRQRFFYAEAEAGLYDASIAWVVPEYELLHATVQRAIQRAVSYFSDTEHFNVLDVGSGTGTDTIDVLQAYPQSHVVAVDLCKPMLDTLGSHLMRGIAGEDGFGRCTLLHADILSNDASEHCLVAALPTARRSKRFSVVLSSLTVHHFEHNEKQAWFQRMFDVIAPGGFLVFADLFSYADPAFTEQCLKFDLAWMREHFVRNAASTSEEAVSTSDRRRLLDGWVEHYWRDNRLEPIESTLQTVGQSAMMEGIGFINVTTLYRYSLSGVLVGQRPF